MFLLVGSTEEYINILYVFSLPCQKISYNNNFYLENIKMYLYHIRSFSNFFAPLSFRSEWHESRQLQFDSQL